MDSSSYNKNHDIKKHTPFVLAEKLTPPTWIEINKNAFLHNIVSFKNLIGKDKFLGVVIKSNAYGHGLIPIAQLCEENHHVNWLLVAHVHEAIELREAGITKRILLVSPARQSLFAAAFYDCDIMVTDYDILAQLNEIGHGLQKKISIHLKVDTGLSRFGFMPQDIIPLINHIQTMPCITVAGIYTHFAESNNSDLTFTYKQNNIFNDLLIALKQKGITIPFRHHSNTAGITAIENNQINLFRLGAGAYGIWPSEQNHYLANIQQPNLQLRNVLNWKTKIVHIKKIPAGSFIGYNRTYQTTKETTIAIIPIGYYDGYDKRLSNKGMVRIKDQNAPIIGTIAMNATTIDISHIPNVHLDETVTLLGPHPQMSAADLANQTGCFNARQITAQINASIPRIIID